MKLSYCTMAIVLPFLCLSTYIYGQPTAVKPLHSGDKVPDVALSMVNYNTTSARLSDFKGKLLILDFWSTTCTVCVHHFAELDSLQSAFGNKIFILPVDSKPVQENTAKVQAFIKGYKQRINNGFTLPSVVNDAVLYKLFPHLALPHYVWIDADGKFIAQTDGDQVNAKNIFAVLNHDISVLSPLIHETNYDPNALSSVAGLSANHIFSQSLLTGYRNGLVPTIGYAGDAATGHVTKLFAINVSALSLFKHAYGDANYLPSNQVFMDWKDSSDFDIRAHWDSLKYTRAFCYELSKSDDTYDAFQKKMQDDLFDFFHIKGSIEQRTTDCFILSVTDSSLLHTKGGDPGNTLYENISSDRLLINQPVSVLSERLNELLPAPVIDETNFLRNLDLQLPSMLTDINALTEALTKQGLSLSKEKRTLKIFVLHKTGNENLSQTTSN